MLNTMSSVEVTEFGRMPDGAEVKLFTVWDGRSVASFTEFGARVVSVRVPDAAGKLADVVLGFDSLAMYLADKAYLGAIVGRYGNRIAGGHFTLDDVAYHVPVNDGPNALHGGHSGFDQQIWHGEAIENGVAFRLTSPDGDQGFPGTLTVEVRFTFADGGLRIAYHATCDQDTVVNLTNHAYFNLAGESSGPITAHQIALAADTFLPVDATMIPTGELRLVEGTPFDLREPIRIGRYIDGADEQLKRAGGFDHTWVLNGGQPAARVVEPESGRTLEVETDQPGVQFYTGNFLTGTVPSRQGGLYRRRAGFCLETQHFPDSPNQPAFPTTVLRAGQIYSTQTTYRFGILAGRAREDKRKYIAG